MRFPCQTCLLLLGVIAMTGVSRAGEAEERARILEVMARVDQARVNGNFAEMRRFYADDFTQTDDDGRTYSLPEVLESEKKRGYKLLSIERHDLHIAFLRGKANVDGRMVVNAQGRNGRVRVIYQVMYEFVRSKQGWLLSKATTRFESVTGRE
jgi:hypothetical protein